MHCAKNGCLLSMLTLSHSFASSYWSKQVAELKIPVCFQFLAVTVLVHRVFFLYPSCSVCIASRLRQNVCSSPQHPVGYEVNPASHSVGASGYLPGGNVASAWSWPLTSMWRRGLEYMVLYAYSSICLQGMVLKIRHSDSLVCSAMHLHAFLTSTGTTQVWRYVWATGT